VTRPNRPQLLASLAEGIAELTTSGAWQRHLDYQSRFHRYSFGNVVLISAQRPGATQVAGFRTWQRVHRRVKRGERAIWILAPVVRHRSEDEETAVTTFRSVPVFDVAQTEGAEPPEVCRRLQGDDDANHYGRLTSVASALGFLVVDATLEHGSNGDCCHERRRIRVAQGNAPVQRVKTLAHELAHAVAHREVEDRRLAELEAESTAYVVCRSLGVDAGCYSFGYITSWAGGCEAALAGLRRSGERIQRTAALLLAVLDETTRSPAQCGPA